MNEVPPSPEDAGSDASLLMFLYRWPQALLQLALDGDILLMTPVAARELMALCGGGHVGNLFDALAPFAPTLRAQAAAFTAPGGTVCEDLRLTVPARAGAGERVLSLDLLKVEPTQLMALLTDVTDDLARAGAARRDFARRLAQATTGLEQALALMSVAVARQDLGTGLVQASPRLREWLGLPSGDTGLALDDLARQVHPKDRAMFLEDHQRAAQGQPTAFREFRVRRADGSWGVVSGRHFLERDEEGQPLALTTFGIDVTEARAREHERMALAERLELATTAAGMGIFEVDADDGRVHWNAQACRLHGQPAQPPDDAAPVLADLLAPADLRRWQDWLHDGLGGAAASTLEYSVPGADGTPRWIASKGQAHRDPAGGVRSLVGVAWDITDWREAEAALQARRVAEQANRAKSEFLSRMSHEFRTPLNAILGFSDILMRGGGTDPARQQLFLGHVHEAGRHLLQLVSDLLDLSRIEMGEMPVALADLDAVPVIDQAVASQRLQADARQIGIDWTPPAQPVVVHADPTRLQQVLLNLLSNAVKYNRTGGTVRLTLSPHADAWRLTVADTGLGMSAEQLAALYQPFNRLGRETSAVSGTGIGLVITRLLVERMGGALSVRSEPGVGTDFHLDLPAGSAVLPAPTPIDLDAGPVLRPEVRGRVLLVEDHALNRELVAHLLEWRPNVVLDQAVDVASGLAAARAHWPDLLLLDMSLPDGDGLALVRTLQAAEPGRRLGCLVLSANALPDDRARAAAAGITDYLAKPFDPLDLLAAVDRHLAAGGPG